MVAADARIIKTVKLILDIATLLKVDGVLYYFSCNVHHINCSVLIYKSQYVDINTMKKNYQECSGYRRDISCAVHSGMKPLWKRLIPESKITCLLLLIKIDC